jgi:hypothetical protein
MNSKQRRTARRKHLTADGFITATVKLKDAIGEGMYRIVKNYDNNYDDVKLNY